MSFDEDPDFRAGVLLEFYEAALRAPAHAGIDFHYRTAGPPESPAEAPGAGAARTRRLTLAAYRARLAAGERPHVANFPRAVLWHRAAADMGVALQPPPPQRESRAARSTASRRARCLADYTRRLQAGERPVFRRPIDFAKAVLWRQAAAALGVQLHGP